MNNDIMYFVGYHGTISSYCCSIFEKGLQICSYNCESTYVHNHWLGQGIYIYDDYNLALKWAENKSKSKTDKGAQNSAPVVIGVKYSAILNEICNLDNRYEYNKFSEFVVLMSKTILENRGSIDFTKRIKHPPGSKEYLKEVERRKLCWILDVYKHENKIAVIEYTFSMGGAQKSHAKLYG